MKKESAELIQDLRRQAAMRNATWPCILLKNLMPLLDEFEEIDAAAAKLTAASEECESPDGAAVQIPLDAWHEFMDVLEPAEI